MTSVARRRASLAPDPTDLGLPDAPRKLAKDSGHVRHVQARVDTQLRALLAHQDGTRAGTDPEELHQFRVAIRRLRSLLKNSPVFGADGDTVRENLRWIGGVTSPVRDLDVMLMRLSDDIADFCDVDREAAGALLAALRRERASARRALGRALSSERYRRLLGSIAALATMPEPELGTEVAPLPGTKLIGSLRKPYRKLARAVDSLGQDPPDGDLHALRIHGKRLRYAAETALPSASKKDAKRLKAVVKATKELQQVLGDHQDAVVAAARIRGLVDEQRSVAPMVALVAGRIVERELIRRAVLRERWHGVWRRVTDATSPLR